MLSFRPRRPAPATVLSVLAVGLALGGTGYASTKIGTMGLKDGAVTAAKLAPNAVRTGKILDGSVVGSKLANGAVGSTKLAPGAVGPTNLADGAVGPTKIADGAVSAAKLDPSVRSAGFAATVNGQKNLTAATATVVLSLNLPTTGNYIVNASTETADLGVAGTMLCSLQQGGTEVAQGASRLGTGVIFDQTIAVTAAITGGGLVTLSCNPSAAAATRHSSITAIQVATITTP